jgi:hypothetical protein
MIVVIGGRRFDTDKAKEHFALYYPLPGTAPPPGKKRLAGSLYLSSKGTWYVKTPSEFETGHRWELIDPAVAVTRYADYMRAEYLAEIIALAELETE